MTESDSLESGAAKKLLRLLAALRQSQAGAVIYRQVERMLLDMTESHRQVEQAYAGIVNALLDVYAQHLHEGSPLQVQVKVLAARLQPPLSVSDLSALRDYIDVYVDQLSLQEDFSEAAFRQALQPLFQAFGLDVAGEPLPAESPPPAEAVATPSTAPQPVAAPPEEAPAEAMSAEPEAGSPAPATLRRAAEPVGVTGEAMPGGEDEQQLEVRRQDIQQLREGLAHQVLDTISQNQEFGVLLEVVLNELHQAGRISEIEDLRWTLIREIERLMAGHHELADKLDQTHQYLQVVELDSRQLSDELSRVRLLSLTDELTGLSNRRAFLRRLEDEVARVQRYGFPLSLALIDLDKFKSINDQYGHAAGDEVLRVYAKNILSIFRHHDLVARYGGEEFAVLLPNTDTEGATRALNKVKERCAETRWQLNGLALPVPTFSAGLAFYKPGETSSAFIERVDKALYRAKRLGRDRIELDLTYQVEGEKPEAKEQGGDGK
ncbi:diguanylate cyclase [Thiohalobacter sp. IOR34]|uniref:GGDEF domain-containing protein n=1 Tax=Thiohalobacter sp. IOR34 TaxID=3057176 RepID=UPI0025B09BC8|nr:diguanylate cyclase [Thiohalobacter sp. IOR34]WJW74764.1 diguanylate cyclase [Thiohalobacter sp. IOR34]